MAKELKDIQDNTIETRDYIGGVEYVDGVLESIYHGEGRLHYVNGTPQMEYTTVDHLGNTRLSYADLNGNGIIETPSEILDEVHYYPNGLKMEGYWMNSDKFRYTFNSIEEIDDFGLNVNRATFRTLDPELGRWWSVDPKAAGLMHLNPYNSMANSPLVYNDPNGDWIHVAIGAVIGGAVNVATHWNQIDGIGGGLKAFGIGAAGGALTAATGAGVVGAGVGKGFAIGALSGMAGDGFAQIGNAAAFGDQYSGKQLLYAGALGGVVGGITGGLTYKAPPQAEKVVREEVFGEFIDTYANFSVTGGNTIKATDDLALQGLKETKAAFAATWDEVATVTASKTVRPTGQFFESIFDLFANPQLLQGKSLAQVQGIIKNSNRWVEGTLSKGRNIGKGWTFRELNKAGTDFTGKYIQYHPGSVRHFGRQPYWKISSGGGTFRFLAQ